MRIPILAALLAVAVPLLAQIDNGNITGRVTDPTGAAIAGAQVNVTQIEMNFETNITTNEEGLYRAMNLRPGPYRVTVTAAGFKKMVRDAVELRVGQTLAVNAAMEMGAVSESVEVSASAALLDTETSAAGATLAGDYFYSLPNYQKHAQAVLFFTPGITYGSNAFTGRVDGMSVDGLSYGALGYFEDGAIGTMGTRGGGNVAETIANSIEDMKVLTSALPAEYGHSTGAVISVVKKSGTNTLHGIVAEQLRTRRMQHRRFFESYRNSQVQPGWEKAPGLFVQNPDANLNGPVFIPKIYDGRNKTFFMFGWQMMIEKQSKQQVATVPTEAMLRGDFAYPGVAYNQIFDPVSTRQVNGQWFRDPFPGNQIPVNRWSNVAKTMLGMNPLRAPNTAGSMNTSGPINNVALAPMKVVKWDNYTGRLDHQFNSSLKAYATWTGNSRWERNPPYTIINPLFDSTMNKSWAPKQNTASAGATWIPSSTVVNDFRATYYGYSQLVDSIAKDQDYATLIGMGGMGLPKTCMPGVWPTGIITEPSGTVQVGCGSTDVQETLTMKDDLNKASGKHSFKMGYELLRWRRNQYDMGNPDGTFTYASTSGITTTGGSVANTGNTLAAFMIGAISNYSFSSRLYSDLPRLWQHSWYFQDDWKISPSLTLNLGIRYNIETPKKQKYGYISLYDPNAIDNATYSNKPYTCPAGGCLGAWTHPNGADPYRQDMLRFDPSVGLAWHPLRRFVVRGGFRLAHIDIRTDSTSLLYSDEMLSNSYSASQVSGNFKPLFMLDQGIPSWAYPTQRADGSVPYVNTNAGTRTMNIVQSDLKTPYVMTWNFGVQTELSRNYLLETRYDGSAQAKGLGTYDSNTRPWGIIPNPNGSGMMDLNDPANAAFRLSWATGGQTQYSRPLPNQGTVNIVGNVYHLSHHAALVRIEKRFSKGLNFQAFYTIAKTLAGGAGNPYLDWGLLKARTNLDQRHNFTGTMNYEIPVGKGRKFMNRGGWVNTLLGDYNMMFTYTIASGAPAGMSITGGPTTNNYPGYMPTYGGVMLKERPSLRDNWQDLGGDRFNAANQNSMIDCGAVQVGSGNDCFSYVPSFTRGTNGSNVWDNQRQVIANAAFSKEVPIKERLKFVLRLDIQNPFKWYNWGGPNTQLNIQSVQNAKTYGTNTGSGEASSGTAGYGGTPLMNLTLAFKW
ncbi:MAG: carboxypeptidase-like regulatory domain-containing protein [Candidatus Solibacter sp.]